MSEPIFESETTQMLSSEGLRTASVPAAEDTDGVENEAPPTEASVGESSAHSTCTCGCGHATQLVYALGSLGIDFGTEARRDSIAQQMGEGKNPYDSKQLLAYLQDNPWDSQAVIWTLNLDATSIYAIRPGGAFAGQGYERLRQFMNEQLEEGVERVSMPGTIAGKVTLFTGQVVPVIEPVLRGMYSWTTKALVQQLAGPAPASGASKADRDTYQGKVKGVHGFLERIYFEFRNLGITPQERAINFAATNAFNVERVYESTIRDNMELDTIEVERSPIGRPDSDCWDVKLLFFYPDRPVQTVRKAFRFTVDVSDVVPVTVGPVRSWFVR